MRFGIRGRRYEINRDDIISAVRGIAPNPFDGRHKYYVELHGSNYPIKQIIHLVTELPNSDFHAGDARRILTKLGFEVFLLESEKESRPITVTTSSTVEEGKMRFVITLRLGEDGFIVAGVPALPGCHSQGKTEEEAVSNIKEAIRGYIASMRQHGEEIPNITKVREVEVVL